MKIAIFCVLISILLTSVFGDLLNDIVGEYADESGDTIEVTEGMLKYSSGYKVCTITPYDSEYLYLDEDCDSKWVYVEKNKEGKIAGLMVGDVYYQRSTSNDYSYNFEDTWGDASTWGEFQDETQNEENEPENNGGHPSYGSGNKRALLVGINYIDSSAELGGCINDVEHHKEILINKFGFQESNIRMLTEEEDESLHPTKANIEAGIEWLVGGLEEGDLAIFHYSGHGSQVPDQSGKESDGKTEVLVPLDYNSNQWQSSFITDTYLNEKLVRAIPEGAKVLALFDCCHSGTVSNVDVTRNFVEDEYDIKPRFLQPPDWMIEMFNEAKLAYQSFAQQSNDGYNYENEVADLPGASENSHLTDSGIHPGIEYWSFSGCRDDQTSADATLDGKRQGAFTWGYLNALEEHNYEVTYIDLLDSIKSKLSGKFEQVPVLGTTSEDRLNRKFLD